MIRFYNGRVLTLQRDLSAADWEVWVEGDRIAYAGPCRPDAPVFSREINLDGDLLMPGFKNAHTHSAMTFLRSYADDLPLREWLFDRVFPLEARLTPEAVYAFTRLAVLEYLSSGITASFDMYFYPEASAQANIDCGFRTVLCGAVSADTEDWTQLERDYLRFSALHPLVSYRLGFHAEYTASVPLLETIASLARQYRAPVWTHNSETRAEVDECLGRHGKTPTALFDSLGLFDYGGGGYHCVHFSEADMAIFRERGLWAVTCPGSNAKLASGIAPVVRMQEAGVQLAIGTDGAASNNALDIFREMYLVSVLQKLREGDAAACSADSVLLMAAQGGARAMGLPDCDAIEAGKQADLVVLSLRKPNMHPFHNLTKNLVYSGSKQNVRLTMVAGRILFEDGAYFVGEDPERIAAEAERLAGEIVRGF